MMIMTSKNQLTTMATKWKYVFLLLLVFLNKQVRPSIYVYESEAYRQSYPCQTYVIFRTKAPDFLDLASVSDLFGVTRPMIAKHNNISSLSSSLLPDQLLLVPISCSYNALDNGYAATYARQNYIMTRGNYEVALFDFQYLTSSEAVSVANPTTDLRKSGIGDELVVPIFCRCPHSPHLTKLQNNLTKYLITYVIQPGDTLRMIASRFGSSEDSVVVVSGAGPYESVYIPISRLPNLPQPTVSSEKKVVTFGMGMGIGMGICGLLLGLVCGVWYYREIRFKGVCRDEEKHELKLPKENLMAEVAGCLDKYKVFKIDELKKATNGFDGNSIIKGSVYRGCIDGEVYAVKKIKWDAYEELKILQKVNHGNLVRLEGFCIDPKESNSYVVYEYVENGSLYSWLHEQRNKNNKRRLSWNTRLRIAIDVANGLQYIHEHARPKVVHKDIKSSNILLGTNMRAKIASFGLAKSGCNPVTMHIVGTRGYIAPEYVAEGIVSPKMDVFSYGVVLLELVSGGEVIDEEGRFLWASAGTVLDGGSDEVLRKLREWMDECLVNDSCTIESVMSVMCVAVACLNKDPTRRPSMVEIVYALSRNGDFVMGEDLLYPR